MVKDDGLTEEQAPELGGAARRSTVSGENLEGCASGAMLLFSGKDQS